MSYARKAQERITEFRRLQRARQLLDAISLVNELLSDGSDVEVLSLAGTVIRRFRQLGALRTSSSKNIENSVENVTGIGKTPKHTGIYHCCTFCSSGGKKDTTCACKSTIPGGYKGCGHGHPGHPGVHHWSCCGSVLRDGHCLIRRKTTYYVQC